MGPSPAFAGLKGAWRRACQRVRNGFPRKDPTDPVVARDGADTSGGPRPSHDLSSRDRRFHARDLATIVQASRDGGNPIETLVHLPAVTVEVPALDIGAEGLARRAVRESESHIAWGESRYGSVEATAFVLRNAVVHGSAGIVGWDGLVVAESLWHTEPGRHHYRRDGAEIVIRPERVTRLSGLHVTILTGGAQNYFHSVIDGVARLAMLPDAVLAEARSLLIPADGMGQRALLDLYDPPQTLRPRPVALEDTLLVERLVLPWTLHHVFSYHPVINRFFDRIVERTPPSARRHPRRFYIDRRSSGLRRLLNEDAVVAALAPFGFEPVRLEDMSPTERIDLLRHAEIIVAPHGAGLTNIGFAPKGCAVIELMMDAYLNWCFRRLAAVRGLRYGCVVGTARAPWADLNPAFHAQVWEISVPDVREAVLRVIAELESGASGPT